MYMYTAITRIFWRRIRRAPVYGDHEDDAGVYGRSLRSGLLYHVRTGKPRHPGRLLIEDPERCVRIPMWGETRSLNLSNSVAIILYEALRQNGFEKLELRGQLHHLHWKDE